MLGVDGDRHRTVGQARDLMAGIGATHLPTAHPVGRHRRRDRCRTPVGARLPVPMFASSARWPGAISRFRGRGWRSSADPGGLPTLSSRGQFQRDAGLAAGGRLLLPDHCGAERRDFARRGVIHNERVDANADLLGLSGANRRRR